MSENDTQNDIESRYVYNDPSDPVWAWIEKVYTFKGKEYRVTREQVSFMTQMYGWPDDVRKLLLFWCKMMHNPD